MTTSFQDKRLDKDNAVVLLIDYQAGLISLVQDYSPCERRSFIAHAKSGSSND